MDDVIVVQNDIDRDGKRVLHLMANQPVDQALMRQWMQSDHPYELEVKISQDEIRLHHLTATWLAREATYYTFWREGNGKKHPVVIWALEPGQRISEAAVDAALLFQGTFGYWPSAAWVRIWPTGLKVDDAFIPMEEECGMDLFAVDWVPDNFVVVGGGFNAQR